MLITLLTDFGTADTFVAAMKGVILTHDASIRIVDITHEVPPQDIAAAGFLLSNVYRDFPVGTVHTVVVDPGVGSTRRAIACEVGGHYLVGPDNGVLDWVLAREGEAQVRAIQNEALRREPVSRTFHGRDLFAPTAAALATGFSLPEVGPRVTDWVRSAPPRPARDGDLLRGSILHIDRFGNGITSFRAEDLADGPARWRFRLGEGTVVEVRDYYAAGPGDRPFVIWGSGGFLEIAVSGGSAKALLEFERGSEVVAERR